MQINCFIIFICFVLFHTDIVESGQRLVVTQSYVIDFQSKIPNQNDKNVACTIQEDDHYSVFLNAYGFHFRLILSDFSIHINRVVDEKGEHKLKSIFWDGYVDGYKKSIAFGYFDDKRRFFGYFVAGNESYYLDRYPNQDDWDVVIYRKSDLVSKKVAPVYNDVNTKALRYVTAESITADLINRLKALNLTDEAKGGKMTAEYQENSDFRIKSDQKVKSDHQEHETQQTDRWNKQLMYNKQTRTKQNKLWKNKINLPIGDLLDIHNHKELFTMDSQNHTSRKPEGDNNNVFSDNKHKPFDKIGKSKRFKRSPTAQYDFGCGVELIADHTYTALMGNDERRTAQEMILALRMASDVYQNTDFDGDGEADGLSLKVAGIIVFRHTRYPWADPRMSPNQVLNAMGHHIQNHCAAITFLARDYGGVLGLAWLGSPGNPAYRGICSRPTFNPAIRGRSVSSMNVGLVTARIHGRSRSRADVALTLAHELGHLFGAQHDNDPSLGRLGWRCPHAFMMASHATSVSWRSSWTFSTCSTRQMLPVIRTRGAPCFGYPPGSTRVQDGTMPTSDNWKF